MSHEYEISWGRPCLDMADQSIRARRSASAANGDAERGTIALVLRGKLVPGISAGSLAFAAAGSGSQVSKGTTPRRS